LELEKKLAQKEEEVAIQKRKISDTETQRLAFKVNLKAFQVAQEEMFQVAQKEICAHSENLEAKASKRESVLQEQLDQQQRGIETSAIELFTAQEEIERTGCLLEESRNAQVKLQNQLLQEQDKAKEYITALGNETDELTVKLLEAEVEGSKMEERIQQLCASQQELTEQRENGELVTEELLSSLKQQLHEAKSTLVSKEEGARERSEKENADLRQSLKEYKRKTDEMRVKSKKLESAKEELDSTKQRLKQVESRLQEVGSLNDTIIDQAQKEIGGLMESVKDLKRQLDATEDKNQKLRGIRGSLQSIDPLWHIYQKAL
jgi:chromosome segregation ATPase